MRPLRANGGLTDGTTGGMYYDFTTSEICYSTTKTFVIDHPKDENKYLVHACLEGPEAGVYYRGTGEIKNNKYTIVELPDYVSSFSNDFTIQVTQVIKNDDDEIIPIASSSVENNKFKVYGKNTDFYWIVYGKRTDIIIEPDKKDVNVKGSGPYLWI